MEKWMGGDMHPSYRILMGPGPSNVHYRVYQAMSNPVIGYLDPQILACMDEISEMLRGIFQTKNKVTLAISATGSSGMEASYVNFVEPGDVVVIDSEKSEHIAKSRVAFDDAVAGVVSTDPAYILNADENGVPLALVGRVPVKVTAENGAIKPGDLLTTSSKPGYAMKCSPSERCNGNVIGKALEKLESGDGKINVLLSLG